MTKDHGGPSFQLMKELTVAAKAVKTCAEKERERGRQPRGGHSTFLGDSSALVVFSAHGQVDEGKDVKLYHY